MFIYAAPVNRTRGSAYKSVGMLTKLWADCVREFFELITELDGIGARNIQEIVLVVRGSLGIFLGGCHWGVCRLPRYCQSL
jgi:hypothetical protein